MATIILSAVIGILIGATIGGLIIIGAILLMSWLHDH